MSINVVQEIMQCYNGEVQEKLSINIFSRVEINNNQILITIN